MRILTTILYLLIALAFSACAPKPVAVATASASAPVTSLAPTLQDTSLLWRITTPGDRPPAYLFGTIHLIPAKDYFLPDRVAKALAESERVFFEIDPREMQNPAMLMQLMGRINMRNDTTLEDLLSVEAYAAVESYFTETGMPFFLFKRMKPLFLSAMIGQDLNMKPALGSEGGQEGAMRSYEMELTSLAEAGDKTVAGLESMDFQLSLFDSIPYRAQAEMLYEAVQTNASGESEQENQLEKIITLYKRQQVAALANTVIEEAAGTARFEELLLTRRNANWVPIIKANLEASDYAGDFYAVGAGHLGGEKGVIALLRAEGLTVEPVY